MAETVRVRAILITPTGDWSLFRRRRPGIPEYWALPGGGVEDSDPGLRSALRREVREEVGGDARIHSLRYVLPTPTGRQYIYLASIARWSEADRTGPEFSDPEAGEYLLETRPLTAATLAAITLRPPGLTERLLADLRSHGPGLFTGAGR